MGAHSPAVKSAWGEAAGQVGLAQSMRAPLPPSGAGTVSWKWGAGKGSKQGNDTIPEKHLPRQRIRRG